MSDDFLDDEFDEQRSEPLDERTGSDARRRAVWGLGVLACVAVIVGTLMVLLGGSHHHDDNAILGGPLPTQRPSVTGSATSTSPTSTPSSPAGFTSQSPTSATTTTPTSPRSGNPCTAAAACKVDGDGGLVAQLNAYRSKHNVAAVPGKVSEKAQSCALAKGNGPSCSPHWIITVMPDQDGAKAVTKMAGFNEAWLLDRKMTSFEVGWAYTGGSYECVILKAQTTD